MGLFGSEIGSALKNCSLKLDLISAPCSDEMTILSTFKIFSAGISKLKYKIEFANQSSGSKEARIRGVSLQY